MGYKELSRLIPDVELVGASWSYVDLLNSHMGDMWEIKPIKEAAQAVLAIAVRHQLQILLQIHHGLTGTLPTTAISYDWTFAPRWELGQGWSDQFAGFPVFLGFDHTLQYSFYAREGVAGTILWWKVQNRKQRQKLQPVPVVIPVPESMLQEERNTEKAHPDLAWVPGRGTVPRELLPGYVIIGDNNANLSPEVQAALLLTAGLCIVAATPWPDELFVLPTLCKATGAC